MQIIFQSDNGSASGHALWWERNCVETLFDAGLVALESISPGKVDYCGTLRCRTLPSKENFPRQRPAAWFMRETFLINLKGRAGTSGYRFEYDLHSSTLPHSLVPRPRLRDKIWEWPGDEATHLDREQRIMNLISRWVLIHLREAECLYLLATAKTD